MTAEIVPIPTTLNFEAQRDEDVRALDELLERVAGELTRLYRLEQTVGGFVAHVEARARAGWHKVPRTHSQHGEVGFEQLVQALEGGRHE